MPLADLTSVANLALDHLGEPYLTDYETDTGTTAAAVRLHLPQCIETVLEGHAWSFATRTAELSLVETTTASVVSVTDPSGSGLGFTFTAVEPGSSGNVSVQAVSNTTSVTIYINGNNMGSILFLSGLKETVTFQEVADVFEYYAGDVVTCSPLGNIGGNYFADISGSPSYDIPETALTGGYTAPAIPPGWSTAWFLPTDCLRLRQINSIDIDQPELRFEIQGRQLLLSDLYTDTDPPAVTYITNDPPVDEWPTTFTDAVAFLLASRLAPKLTQSQTIADSMFQKHEIALGKARSKDTRETRSAENNTPRMLAAKSGLVQSRYGRTSRPPY